MLESFHGKKLKWNFSIYFKKRKKAINTHICSWSIFLALGINSVGQMKAIPLNSLWYLKSSLVLLNCYLELTAASAWKNDCWGQSGRRDDSEFQVVLSDFKSGQQLRRNSPSPRKHAEFPGGGQK